MEIQNEIDNNIKIENNNFLNNMIGKIINNSIDIGLKTILPDLIENQIIDIKNALLENGLKGGIKTAVETGIDFGKSTIGIFTGNFENMTQVRIAVSDGGIIDTMSNILDNVIDKMLEKGYMNRSVTNVIKNGKDVLLENISNNIKKELDDQTNSIEKLNRYVDNWKEYYNNKDFEGMTMEYNKIKKQITNIIPLENIIRETREIEVLHNLIENNGQNFDISNLEKKLVKNLAN